MKVFNKMKRAISVLMLTLVLFTIATNNSVALGVYTESAYQAPAAEQQLEEAIFPAVAVVGVGVLLVGAFAYGVYEGYREASNRGAHLEEVSAVLDPYQSNDFSQFDTQAAVL